jgi:hypothetical protein
MLSELVNWITTRSSHARDCYGQLKGHKAVTVFVAGALLYATYTTYYTLVGLPEWAKPENLPKLSIHTALIFALLGMLLIVVEGSYRMHGSKNPLYQSIALGAIPLYPQDVKIYDLSLYPGTTLIEDDNTIFLNFSIFSDWKTGLRDITVTIYLGEERHECTLLDDLSTWIARTELDHAVIPYKRFDDRNLDELSLWRDVQRSGLDSGIVKRGWVGVRFPGLTWNSWQKINKIRIEVRKAQNAQPYRFTFLTWNIEPKEKISTKPF